MKSGGDGQSVVEIYEVLGSRDQFDPIRAVPSVVLDYPSDLISESGSRVRVQIRVRSIAL